MPNSVNTAHPTVPFVTDDELILRLHSQLDVASLLEEFAKWAGAAVRFSEVHYRHPTLGLFESSATDTIGAVQGCSPHDLGELGQLYFLHHVPFSATQQQLLASSIDILLPPLMNAVRYQSAIRQCDSLTQRLMMSEKSCRSITQLDTSAQQQALEMLVANGELQRALSNDALTVFYQPKVDLYTGEVRGLEALLRWHHAERGLLSPEQFIPLAERYGLIPAITRWVLNTVLRQCSQWQQQGLLVPIAVNLSGLDLEDGTLPDHLAQLLEAWAIPAQFLELEITETAAIADQLHGVDILRRIAKLGINVAIDDFGIGYSSLQRLKQLPVNTIKIDKSFVMEEGRSEHDLLFVDTIARLGHQLGMKVVAEGVDCLESWQRLLSTGCDMAQGYHISHPLPGDAATGWLRQCAAKTGSQRLH